MLLFSIYDAGTAVCPSSVLMLATMQPVHKAALVGTKAFLAQNLMPLIGMTL